MSILWFTTKNTSVKPPDNCGKCSSKICCVVFRICSHQDQWRKENIIKEWGEKCEHLRKDSGCSVYRQRESYPWYAENCIDYTCFNVWPLIDIWIRENNISLVHEASKIAYIMKRLWEFITLWSRYQERYAFIRDFLLTNISSSVNLVAWLDKKQSDREKIFNEWTSAHPLDPEFDRKLKLLLSE